MVHESHGPLLTIPVQAEKIDSPDREEVPTGEKLIILKDAVYLDSHNVRVAFPTLYPHLAFLQLPGIRPLCINPPLYICKAPPPCGLPPLLCIPIGVPAGHMLGVC